MAYRGCGKSFLTAGYVLWRLRKNPDTKVLVISAAQDRADAFSVFCHDLLRNWFMVQDLFPSDTQRFSKVAFDVFGSKPDQSPSVRSSGIFGQITGSRADLIVADDVETLRAVRHNSYEISFESLLKSLIPLSNQVERSCSWNSPHSGQYLRQA